jgi:hypothetical protein
MLSHTPMTRPMMSSCTTGPHPARSATSDRRRARWRGTGSPRALLLTFAVAAAAFAAAPAVASADSFCINAGADCPTGGLEFATLQGALNKAVEHSGADEILLGDKGTPYFGPFVYQPFVRAGAALTLKGVGGRPALTGPVDTTVLTVKDTSLEGVDVVTDFGEGQALDVRDSSLREVRLFGLAQNAPDLHGIRASGTVTIEDSLVKGGYAEGLEVLGGLDDERDTVTARGLRIESGDVGILVGQFSSLTLSDSRVRAAFSTIHSQGFAEVSRSVLETARPHSLGLSQFEASGGFKLDHVTVAHRGAPSGTDTALLLNTDNPDADTRLHAVALAGYSRGFRRVSFNGLPNAVIVRESVWDPALDELGGMGAGVFVESGNAHVAPALADLAGGDLRPRAGSALIDRDALSDISQFADLDGSPALDGDGDGIVRPDAGAFEFRPGVPTPPGGGSDAGSGGGADGGASGPGADLTAPVLSKLGLRVARLRVASAATLSLRRARKLRLVFSASEAATIKIVPRRLVDGRLATARRAIARKVAAGSGSITLGKRLRRLGALRPGQLRLLVSATDAAGNRSAKRVLKLRLRK